MESIQDFINKQFEFFEQIKEMNDPEKIKHIESLDPNSISTYDKRRLLITALSDDDKKIQYAYKYLNPNDRIIAFRSLKSDEKKFNIATTTNLKKDSMSMIFRSMQSDKLKIESLKQFDMEDQWNKKAIIKQIDSDDLKIQALKEYLLPSSYIDVLSTLKSYEKKMECIYLIKNDPELSLYISALEIKDDKTKLKLITEIDDEIAKKDLAIEINDKDTRKKAINCLINDGDKTNVILTLNPDERIEYLNEIFEPNCQYEIIDSIKNDEDKIKNLDLIKDEQTKTLVIESLKDDKQIKKCFYTLKNEDNKVSAIISLHNDSDKLDLIKNLKSPIAKNIVIASLSDKEKVKQKFLPKDRKYKSLGLKKSTTAGIEIESWGMTNSYFLKMGGLFKDNNDSNNRKRNLFDKWNIKVESSVDGIETVSPIITDNEEQVEEIYTVCELLKEGNQRIDSNCGGHIHIGFSALNNNIYAVDFLEEMFANCERILYIISNAKGEIPELRIFNFALPIGRKFKERNTILKFQEEEKYRNGKSREIDIDEAKKEIKSDLQKRMLFDKKIQVERFSDLNLMNVHEVKNTIEFRAPNGTLNPDTWIENIKLYGRLVEKSEELAEIYQKENRTEEEERILKQEEKLTTEISDDEKFEILMQLLFEKDEKNIYIERYVANKQAIYDSKDENNALFGLKFSSKVNIVRDDILPISEIKDKLSNENQNKNLNTKENENTNKSINDKSTQKEK